MTEEREIVRELLKKHGYNSASYNILKEDKQYFFSQKGIEGVIAYVDVADVYLAAGDAVCSDSDMIHFVHEFRKFCKKSGKVCCFQAVSKKFRDVLDLMGFGFFKIGEEPFFDLNAWAMAGQKFKDVRNNINHAKREGFSVIEYRPLEVRVPKHERQMNQLSKKWLEEKKTGEFSFLVGSVSLKNPGERKYFLVLNRRDSVEAFIICVPFHARKGIYLDIMRRKEKPERGTTELLITETFRILKEQGYSLASLGAAPLADVTTDEEKKQLIQHALDFAYHNLNYFYRFKPLFEYKEQFGPSFWEPKYMAYYPPNFRTRYIYAVLKAYDPKGITDIVLSNLRSIWKSIRNRV